MITNLDVNQTRKYDASRSSIFMFCLRYLYSCTITIGGLVFDPLLVFLIFTFIVL